MKITNFNPDYPKTAKVLFTEEEQAKIVALFKTIPPGKGFPEFTIEVKQ